MIAMLLAVFSGALVSFMLGLVGGGGSILAIPLLVHVVGVRSPHVAIGVSAVAVAMNAVTNLLAQARHGRVKWRCAIVFALSGAVGALAGSVLGKATNGQALLAVFGVLMITVGATMFRPRRSPENPHVHLDIDSAMTLAPRLTGTGVATGAVSGFFGIGGGFLITPALIWATGMPIDMAISSSLVGVAAFALTTATSYAFAGLVDWSLAVAFILGGVGGAFLSAPLANALSRRKALVSKLFAGLVVAVGLYVALRGAMNFIQAPE